MAMIIKKKKNIYIQPLWRNLDPYRNGILIAKYAELGNN